MKKFKITKYLLIFSLFFSYIACEDANDSEFTDAIIASDLPWKVSTNLDIVPTEEKEAFVIYRDVLSGSLSWGNEMVELNVQLKSAHALSTISKVEFLVTAEEKDGYNYTAPFDTEAKSIETVSSISENGSFTFELNGNDLGTLFASKYTKPRNETSLIPGDLFQIHWVITSTDGEKMDSRNNVDGDYTYGIKVVVVDVAPPIFKGTFEYEWTAVSAGGLNYGGVSVGQKGNMIIDLAPKSFTEYTVNHLGADYYYGGPGSLVYDYESGLVTIIDSSWRAQKWNITKVEGNTLTIDWTYYYTPYYDESGTFTLTRTDGEDWPTNIHTE